MEEDIVLTAPEEVEGTVSEYGQQVFTVTPVEESVIRKAVSGDEEAFEELFMGTYRYVFAAVRKYLKNDQDAYDAIQDTYTRVYKGLPSLKSTAAFYPWLHRIAVNCAKDILKLSGQDVMEASEWTAVSDDETPASDVTADIAEVLKQLPPEQAELLIRVYYDRMRTVDIARMQGLSKQTVHNRLKAAKKKLKELLKIRGIDKPIYGGDLVALLSAAIRNAIGTQLLSMAVAEEILHSVTASKNRKGAFVVSSFARKARSKAALKIASTVVLAIILFCALFTALAFIIAGFFGSDKTDTPPTGDLSHSASDRTDDDTSSGNRGTSSSHKDTSHNTSGSGGSLISALSTASSNSKPTSSSSAQTSSGTGGSSNSASSAVSSNSKPTNGSSGPASSEDSSDATVSILASPGLIAEEDFELDAAFATGKNGLRVSNIYGSSHRAVMYGDWIYYTYAENCIYRMKTDGSERTLIYRDLDVAIGVTDIGVSTPGPITNLAVIDGRLYFSCMQVILSCKPDGSDIRIEADSRSEDLMWFGEMGKIYFEGDYGYARDWIFDLKRNKLMAAPIRILTVYDGKFYGNSNGNFVVYDISTKTAKVLRYYTTYMEVFVNDDYIVGYQGTYNSNSLIQNRCIDLFNRKSGTYVKTLVLGNSYLFTHDYGGNLTVCYQQSESKAAILDVNTGEVTYTEFDSSSANFYFTSPDLPYVYVDNWGSLIRYDRYLTSSKIIFE